MSRNMSNQMLAAFKEDGVDHVRVNIRAATYIGRQLSPDYCYEFFIPNVGTFTSAKCFANWLVTMDDAKRSDSRYNVSPAVRNNPFYREAILYGKLSQLCATRPRNLEKLINLPFISYNVYPGGVVEADRWSDYASRAKEILEHYMEHGPKVPFDFNPAFIGDMKAKIKEISAQYKELVENTEGIVPQTPKRKKKKKPTQVAQAAEAVQEETTTEEEVETEPTTTTVETPVEEVNMEEELVEVAQEVVEEVETETAEEVVEEVVEEAEKTV